jgi:hypothetical protein
MIMRRSLASAICLLMSVLVAVSTGSAQSGIMSARSAGLRGSNLAEFSGVDAFHLNPASLAIMERTSLVLSHAQDPENGVSRDAFDVPVMSQQGFGLGASVGLIHRGYLPAAPGRMIGWAGEFGVGYEFVENLSFGSSLTFTHASSNGIEGAGAYASFGLLYAPASEISYTITYGRVGTESVHSIEADSISITSGRMPQRLQIGIAMRFPSPATSRPQVFGISVGNEKILGEDGLIYRGGIEVFPTGFVALRVGYEVGPQLKGYSLGMGLVLGVIRLDYALSQQIDFFRHYVTVGYEL